MKNTNREELVDTVNSLTDENNRLREALQKIQKRADAAPGAGGGGDWAFRVWAAAYAEAVLEGK